MFFHVFTRTLARAQCTQYTPPLVLILCLVGLPQLCETVYTPSLPEIAHALSTPASWVEYTLSIYLLGFAFGTLFWGRLSDTYGRKPCVLLGLLVFILGSFGCYAAHHIYALLLFRFIQAFGGSIGSVLGQAMCRDSFSGPNLGRVFALITSALSLFPAMGPPLGGAIAQYTHWRYIFLFLVIIATALIIVCFFKLPETHNVKRSSHVTMGFMFKTLMMDRHVLGCALLVGLANGLYFSYFAEASFYFIKILSLTPSQYGTSFTLLAMASLMGGYTSRAMQKAFSPTSILKRGIVYCVGGASVMSAFVLYHTHAAPLPHSVLTCATLGAQMLIMFGFCMITGNALSIALRSYSYAIGTASSVFGGMYYLIIALCTFLMGALHDGTLRIMPLYFLILSILMAWANRSLLHHTPQNAKPD